MTDPIALQKRVDEIAAELDTEDRLTLWELRSAYAELVERLAHIRRAAR